MRRHFRNVHPMDPVKVPKEGRFEQCERFGMQVNPLYPRHRHQKSVRLGRRDDDSGKWWSQQRWPSANSIQYTVMYSSELRYTNTSDG
jgi:hypothetical protein